MLKNPNRIAVYLTVAAGLLAALAPVVADLDLSSTASVVAGLTAIVVVVNRWLQGWQQMEAVNYQAQLMDRQHIAAQEARQAAGKPARRGSGLDLPR